MSQSIPEQVHVPAEEPSRTTAPPATVATVLPGPPRLYRNSGRGIIGGVAAGIGEYFGVRPTLVRIVLAVLAGFEFFGLLLYIAAWLVLRDRPTNVPPPDAAHKVALTNTGDRAKEKRRGKLLVIVAIIFTLISAVSITSNVVAVIVPLAIVAVGAGLVWRELDSKDDSEGTAGDVKLFAFVQDRFALARVVGGGVLVVVGLSFAVFQEINVAQFGSAFVVAIAAIGGILLLTVPLWMRLWRTMEAERAARVREQERANIASHLHDSVLQTLALIQKRAEDPAQVTKLARRQERELRQWLFAVGERSRNDPTSVAAAVERIAEDIEDTFELRVSQVVVGGDAPLGDNEQAALAAARECLVNVAKHAGVEQADMFCEILPPDDGNVLELFVRDRGQGFDPDTVPDDRRGLAMSVHQRIESRGGTVRVRSKIGSGTEVAIRIPLSTTEGDSMQDSQ